MALDFKAGDPAAPRGHALVYFSVSGSAEVLASYLVVLPIAMDMGKYLPPLLASQLGGVAGGMLGEGVNAFAAPPVPEPVPGGVAALERLAALRGDDLLEGGTLPADDLNAAMAGANAAAEEYRTAYEAHVAAVGEPGPQAPAPEPLESPGEAGVQRVLYELMPERERLAELSKLVGTLRFAVERDDAALAQETEDTLRALASTLPPHFWALRVLEAARDGSERGARLSQLYIERCYKLADEDFLAVSELEGRIAAEG
jgi:hypothetical protein